MEWNKIGGETRMETCSKEHANVKDCACGDGGRSRVCAQAGPIA